MLVLPVVQRLQGLVRNTALASVATLLLVVTLLAGGTLAFGAQLVRVAELVPAMISMVAQQLAASEPDAGSLMKRARDALRELRRTCTRHTRVASVRAADSFGCGRALGHQRDGRPGGVACVWRR